MYDPFIMPMGIKIIENSLMTEDGEPYDVERTWKERLFTRPWNPLKSHKTVVPQVPSKQILQRGYTFIMHPVIAQEFRRQVYNGRS